MANRLAALARKRTEDLELTRRELERVRAHRQELVDLIYDIMRDFETGHFGHYREEGIKHSARIAQAFAQIGQRHNMTVTPR